MTFNKYKKSIDNGTAGEKRFDSLAEKRGCAVIEASKRDNMIRKIDRYIVDENGLMKSVDVKIMKRTSRSDANAQDTWIWVEFNNVNGNDGWLYGEADYIAFERRNNFTLVNRLDLVKIAEELVDLDARVSSSKLAKYKSYRRYGRSDLIAMMELDKIIEMAEDYEIWYKE
jgi:hypothetical protein